MLPRCIAPRPIHNCREEVAAARDRLLNGLSKLQQTNSTVDSMKSDLALLQPILEAKAAATAQLLVQVGRHFSGMDHPHCPNNTGGVDPESLGEGKPRIHMPKWPATRTWPLKSCLQ